MSNPYFNENRLWYGKPAAEWIEGLPIGNGRIAAMVMGGVKRERLALNHEWLWKGDHRDRRRRSGPASGSARTAASRQVRGGHAPGQLEAFGGAGASAASGGGLTLPAGRRSLLAEATNVYTATGGAGPDRAVAGVSFESAAQQGYIKVERSYRRTLRRI